MFGNFGEVSEDTHTLISKMANNRARMAPNCYRRSLKVGETSARFEMISSIKRKLSVAGVSPISLTAWSSGLVWSGLVWSGRLGTGARAATGMRCMATQLERVKKRAKMISRQQGRNICNTGFTKLT